MYIHTAQIQALIGLALRHPGSMMLVIWDIAANRTRRGNCEKWWGIVRAVRVLYALSMRPAAAAAGRGFGARHGQSQAQGLSWILRQYTIHQHMANLTHCRGYQEVCEPPTRCATKCAKLETSAGKSAPPLCEVIVCAFVGCRGPCAFEDSSVTMFVYLFTLFSTAHMAMNADLLKPGSDVFYLRGTTGERVPAPVVGLSSFPECVAIRYER